MNNVKEVVMQRDLLTIIHDYILKTNGLSVTALSDDEVVVCQKNDAKKLKIRKMELIDVLIRKDSDGKEFLQINFSSGKKILLTDQLVGFKPQPVTDLDVTKLPRVVTTLDLVSVFEAIEEAVSNGVIPEEADALKKVFTSILSGGEAIGFDLSSEKLWLKRISYVPMKSSA